jgi:peptide subunit release factor 1 (eRF1)
VARDPDTIQREIEKARSALAESIDVLSERANPKKFVDAGKESLLAKFNEPKVRYALIAVGAIVGLAVLRKLFR